MAVSATMVACELLMCGLKKLPAVGTAIEVVDAVRLRHELMSHDDRIVEIERHMSRFEKAQRDVVAAEIKTLLENLSRPGLDGPSLTEEIRNLRLMQEQGWNPNLFEGLLYNSSHWSELHKSPQHYGRILSDTDTFDSECFHVIITNDKHRILELKPFVLSQLMGGQAKGVPKARVLSSQDIWAVPIFGEEECHKGGDISSSLMQPKQTAENLVLATTPVTIIASRILNILKEYAPIYPLYVSPDIPKKS